MINNAIAKPKTVFKAELALWLWTAWVCLYGLYDTRNSIPELEQSLDEQLQGAITIAPETIMHGAIAGYAIIAVISIWVIVKIGAGKHWARSSFIWGLGFQILTTLMPPYHGLKEHISDIPDLGLQLYAAYLLYTMPAKAWFEADAPKKKV